MIPITRPFFPPQKEYEEYLSGIWNRHWLTNMGPLHSQLEMELKFYLNVSHLIYVNNGTIALQMAIKALDLKGDIITTPFSFIATTSSIVWEGCNPVFVDINKNSLNIDPSKIEAAITPETTAILATHVYGNPCDVIEIEKIALRHNLKVIYDGAHAFGVTVNGKSIFEYGDISICSLHATKMYHSIEGGLVFTRHAEILKKLALMRNFGFDNEHIVQLGINAKNCELHAAMGLLNLKYIKSIVAKYKEIIETYNRNLKSLKARRPIEYSNSVVNNSYYPLIFETNELMMECIEYLKQNEVYTRRYFYPSLSNSLPYLKPSECEVSEDIASRVLCLPLYYDLSIEEVNLISRLLLRVQNN
ncbi:MAG: DegT/DnrJ/EryC1/StrS family aminotransferase [Ginsengibacter sp.]